MFCSARVAPTVRPTSRELSTELMFCSARVAPTVHFFISNFTFLYIYIYIQIHRYFVFVDILDPALRPSHPNCWTVHLHSGPSLPVNIQPGYGRVDTSGTGPSKGFNTEDSARSSFYTLFPRFFTQTLSVDQSASNRP